MKNTLHYLMIFSVVGALSVSIVHAQVGIGTDTPNTKAVLDLKSPNNNQGFLVPRLTTAQRTTMSLGIDDKGMLVFDSSDSKFYYWNGTAWTVIEDTSGTGTVTNITTGSGLTGGPITVTGTISLADNGVTSAKILDGAVATSDLANNSVTTAKVADGAVTDAKITSVAPAKLTAGGAATGQVLKWSGSAWTPQIDNGGTDAQTLSFTSPNLSISGGNSINLSAINTDAQALTYTPATGLLAISGGNNVTITGTLPGGAAGGDLTGTYPNPTITNGVINSAKILDGTIATADLADNSITSVKVVDGTLTNADISASAGIAATKVAAGTNGQVLTTVAGSTAWAAAPTASGTAGGDLTGTYPSPTVAPNAITTTKIADGAVTDAKITSVAPAKLTAGGAATGQVLKWSGSAWTPQIDNGGTDAQTLSFTSPNLSISGGNSINLSAINTDAQALTYTPATGLLAISGGNNVTITGTLPGGAAGGDLTGTYPNPTITNGVINSAKILDGTIATADLADNSITSVKVVDGTLTNADISASAGIAATKVAAGTNGQVLTTVAGSTAWAAAPTASGTAGGDLNGTYPNPTVDGLQGRPVTNTLPTTNQVLKWNGTAWAPGTDATGGGGVGGGGANDQVAIWSGTADVAGKSTLVFNTKDDRLGINTANPLGTLHVMGSQFVNHIVIADDYTVKATDYSIVVNNTGKPVSIALPEIDPSNVGRVLIIRSLNSSPVVLVGFGGKERIQTDEDLVTAYAMGIGNGEFLTLTIIGTQMAGGPRWMVVSGIRSRAK